MMPYTPQIDWTGGECPLHIRLIDGVPVLFDDRGRMVKGQVSVKVESAVDKMMGVTATILVEREPSLSAAEAKEEAERREIVRQAIRDMTEEAKARGTRLF
jgi:hypothetical protein